MIIYLNLDFQDRRRSDFESQQIERPFYIILQLFKDFDDEFFKDLKGHFAQHFSSHKMQHESAGGHFDFADVNFEEFFNSPFGQHEDSDMFGKDMDMFGSSSKVRREMKNGQKCKTVTQKVGNMVTTYTHCS